MFTLMDHRIYIPLPDAESRLAVLQHLLKGQQSGLKAQDLDRLVRATGGDGGQGWSGAASVCM